MFGLFKKETPQDKLAKALLKSFDDTARMAMNDSPNEMFTGTFVMNALGHLKKSLDENSLEISLEYGVPNEQVKIILQNCLRVVHNEYIEYPKL